MIEISPSVLGADLLRLGEEIKLVEKLGLKWLHLDQMDGHFVPNVSFGPDFVAAMRRQTELFLDVHLMFTKPMEYIRPYARAGANMISVHAETEGAEEALKMIAEYGVKAGVAINPLTKPELLRSLLPFADMVIVMTVQPGFGGQSLSEECLAKIPVIREMIRETGREILIEVDGGVKQENAKMVIDAGADILVIGTGLFRAKDPKAVVKTVMKAAEGK